MTTIERPHVVISANWVQGPAQGEWTYHHYATLPDDGQRYEIIDGVLYMTPALSSSHQTVAFRIARYLAKYIEDRDLGQVFVSPIDVELSPRMVLQPDVLVLLNTNEVQILPSHILGTPDLVVEVSSPSTAGHDRREKQDAYARTGVVEYWIVDPLAWTIELLLLEGKAYHSQGVFSGSQTLPSVIVPPLKEEVQVEQFFAKGSL